MIRSLSTSVAALALVAASSIAAAQDGKPIEWVVGYAAGGGSDIVARTIAESMGASLARPVIINHERGAGPNIAAVSAGRSKDVGNLVFSADFATLAATPCVFCKVS